MNGHCLFLVIVCLVSVLIDFSAAIHLGISARDSNSCFWINSISNGQTHHMFLHQTTVGKERSFVLFDSIWSKENSLVDCIASSNRAVIKSFLSKCLNASDKPDGHFNISMLVEPDGPCVAVGQSPELRKPVRRTRDLQSMDRKIIYRNNGESFQKLKRSKRAWLVPGTLWCGSGNKASNFSDLGLFEETDKCCREHDHCEQTIASFEFGYGVFNTKFFTLSHCDCDSKFRRCLHNVNDRMSNMVGYGYFNLLKMQCFEFSQRIECSERTWWGMCKHTQMSTYALLKEATDYNSTSEEVNDKLDLSIHHTVSFGDLAVTNDLVMPSDIVTKEANEKHSSVSVPERISVTVNTFQESGALGKTIDSTKTQTTDSQHVKTTGLPQRQTTDSPESETTDSAQTQTDSPKTQTTEAPKTDPTDSSIKGTTDSLRTQTDSRDSTISTITESAEIPQIKITDSSKPQTDSPKMETNLSKTQSTGSTNLHIHPEIYTRQKDILDSCESYKDLDTCSYQIPALREKFGLHNAEHATLYHCNCTARLARVLAEEDDVDKVHFWLLDFVSQSCFFLPQDCTGSESCSTSFSSHDAPLIERWSKGAAVWRHLAAPRRKDKRLNFKRSKRKDSPVRLHRKCLRMHSKLHHPKTPEKEVMQTVQ